ncbi:hypothetical protein KUTG_04540 [Kutzneria sp. 744]|nr:class I SAM-dependent methyltransferase [Kutzneria sp. 744]EWM14236.1 hypothetical protein KUTG_04540 [Kutzneria sp. 744]
MIRGLIGGVDRQTWTPEHYRRSNSRQFRTAVEALELAGLHGGRLADVGCGSGEITRELAARGYAVTASDFSPAMVEATRELCLGLPVTVEVRDARKLELEPGAFDIGTAPGCCTGSTTSITPCARWPAPSSPAVPLCSSGAAAIPVPRPIR